MKDEFKGKIISEFVGLKSNMYSSLYRKINLIKLTIFMYSRLT